MGTGTIESFNFQATSTTRVLPAFSVAGDWNICIRKNKGMCGTTYAAATTATSTTEDTFQIHKAISTDSSASEQGTTCTAVRLAFDGVGVMSPSHYCGTNLNEVAGLATDGKIKTTGYKIRHQTINTAATGGSAFSTTKGLSGYK